MNSTQQGQNLFTDEEIQNIIEKDIFEVLGITDLTEEKKEELYAKMLVSIQERVILRIDSMLDEPAKQELSELLGNGNKETFDAFMIAHNVDTKKIFAEETLIYKTEMATLMKAANEMPASQSKADQAQV